MKTIFKHLSKTMMMLLLSGALYAQVPQQFNYQGIARDAKGNPISKQRLSVKLSVLPTADASQAEYEEVQSVTTNDFGLYTLQIGNGEALFGEMKNVKWETGNKYIRVAIDPKGGSDYVDLGTTQLLSVPYAIYADRAGSAKNGSNTRALNNFIEKTDGSGNVNATSQIFDNGTNIGIGTTSPVARVHVNANAASVLEHVRMQNTNANGAGRFTMYSDGANNYSTFTKYGGTYAGSYPGLTGLYPYANLLAFGNNGYTTTDGLGRFLITTSGNIGMSLWKGGTSKLKLHIDYATERVGIGNNIAPAAPVHVSNAGASDTMKFTNSTMGHTATDGFEIRTNGNNARLINRENAFLLLGTNNTDRLAINGAGNVGIGTITPTTALDVNGQIRMQGGSPGVGKIMTSDATGIGSWSTAASAGLVSGSGTTHFVPKFTPNGSSLGNSMIYDSMGLYYNSSTDPGPFGSYFMKFKNPDPLKPNYVEITGNQAQTALFLQDSSVGLKALVLRKADASSDSMALLHYNYLEHKFKIGDNFNQYFTLNMGDGRVGIGTVSPSAKLSVVGGSGEYIMGDFTNYGSGADRTALLRMTNGNTTPRSWLLGTGGQGNGLGITNGQFYIEQQSLGARLLIDTLGNVGIGNNNPTSRLDVNGKAIIRDTLTVNSGGVNTQMRIESDGGYSSIQLNRGGVSTGYYAMNLRTGPFGTTEFYTQLDGVGVQNSRFTIGGDGENYVIPGTDNTMLLGTGSNRWAGIHTNNLRMTNGAAAGRILTSDASGNASWSANAPGTIADMLSLSTSSNTPTNTLGFLSNNRIAVNITSSTQTVLFTGTVTLGSTAVGGADGLNIYPAYNTNNAITPVVALGGGTWGIRTVQNSRNTYTVTFTVTGLTPGTYYFGVAGVCNTTPANWNSNEFGYMSVMVKN